MEIKIILWDDDIGWCERLRKELEKENVAVEEAEGWEDLQWRLLHGEGKADLCYGMQGEFVSGREEILAVLLSGQKLIEELREGWEDFLRKICRLSAIPVLYIAEALEDEEELQVFSLGVSDYIGRKRDISICVARIYACVLKCGRNRDKDGIEWGFTMDERAHQFNCGGVVVNLTPKEYLVLSRLFQDRGKVVPRKELLSAAWGVESLSGDRVLDTIIKQLRGKLKPLSLNICSKYGVGYMLKRNLSKNA